VNLFLQQWAHLIVAGAVIAGIVISAVAWQCSTPDRVKAQPGEVKSDPPRHRDSGVKVMSIPEIFADFNAQHEDGTVSMETRGSKADIAKHGLKPGDSVFLNDNNDIGAVAVIEERAGRLFAKLVTDIFDLDISDDDRLGIIEPT